MQAIKGQMGGNSEERVRALAGQLRCQFAAAQQIARRLPDYRGNPEGARTALDAPVRACLDQVDRLIRELDQAYGDSGEAELDLDDVFELTGPCSHEERPSLAGSLRRQLSDTCFGATFELRCARRGLDRDGDSDRFVVACETACRKLRRALSAVVDELANLYDIQPVSPEVEVDDAIAVRSLYTTFRRSLHECDENDATSVERWLRNAACSLAILFSADAFDQVRVRDAYLLKRLQARLFAWARSGKSLDEGRQLYHDIKTTAEILRGINRRQELQLHDQRVLVAIRDAIERSQLGVIPKLLTRLHGLCDRLDDIANAVAAGTPGAFDRLSRHVGDLFDEDSTHLKPFRAA